jgi:hypothetical protein
LQRTRMLFLALLMSQILMIMAFHIVVIIWILSILLFELDVYPQSYTWLWLDFVPCSLATIILLSPKYNPSITP